MKVALAMQRNPAQGLIVEFVRVSLYLVVLLVGLLSYLFQPGFINWSFLGPFYGLIAGGLIMHVFLTGHLDGATRFPRLFFLSFLVDAAFFSLLIYFSGVNQSLFLFLHLVSILLAGLVFQSSGALIVALFTSIFFTGVSIFSPDMKAMNFLFLLALNNIAFFTVAGLSGYLSEQLQSVGRELTRTGLNLKASLEFNRVLVDHMPLGMVSFAKDGKVLQANAWAEKIFARPLAEANWFHLLPEYRASHDLQRGDFKFKSGESDPLVLGITVSNVFSPLIQDVVYIALIEDLTQVRQLEYNLRQNEKLAAIGGLAAGIAHEIRNPLAGISGSVELLSQNANNDDDRKLMKIILREIDRLNNLITEFLDYARPEKPPTDPVDLVSLLREVLEATRMNKQLRADVRVEENFTSSAVILGHRDKLKQAFLNIVLNAYQAMQDSTNPALFVSIEIGKGEAVVRLRDAGCGMNEGTRRRMFEPFHTTKPKGTGLGLAVTHKILEGHRARIFVESEVGKGTEFILHFPLVQSEMK